MAFALRPLGLRDTPAEYLDALSRLRAMRQIHKNYVRPTRTSAGGTSNATAYGIFSKVPPEERLVAEERDCWAHARAARELGPWDCRSSLLLLPSLRWCCCCSARCLLL